MITLVCVQNDFLNWGANPSGTLKPAFQATVIKELPFVGRTIYRDHYQGNQCGKDNDMLKLISNSRYGTFRYFHFLQSILIKYVFIIKRSPVSPDFPFMGETTHNSTYKPFKTLKSNDGPQSRKVTELNKIMVF